jgi:hypothetical protein
MKHPSQLGRGDCPDRAGAIVSKWLGKEEPYAFQYKAATSGRQIGGTLFPPGVREHKEKPMSAFPYDISKWVVVGILITGAVATGLVGALMRPQTRALKQLGYGIAEYELAFFRRFSVEDVLTAWGEEGRRIARNNVVLDFWFVPAYVLMFAGLVLLTIGDPARSWLPVGWELVLAPLVAGGLDVIENLFLLSLLRAPGNVSPGAALAAGLAAAIKFVLLGGTLFYCLASIVTRLVQRFILRA